jgi:hypothetical protein
LQRRVATGRGRAGRTGTRCMPCLTRFMPLRLQLANTSTVPFLINSVCQKRPSIEAKERQKKPTTYLDGTVSHKLSRARTLSTVRAYTLSRRLRWRDI